ncbi:MAG: hypothetical protein ACK491_15275, partial [Pseudanabaena sp.]
RASGVLREIMTALHEQVREQAEKKPKWTTLIIVDSQATKIPVMQVLNPTFSRCFLRISIYWRKPYK